MGPSLSAYLCSLKPVQLKELSEEFSNIDKMVGYLVFDIFSLLLLPKGDWLVKKVHPSSRCRRKKNLVPTLVTTNRPLWIP